MSKRTLTLLASMLVTFVLGSVHAFSVFIAWGFAGLVAPWRAGLIYDLRAGYGLAMVIAAVIAITSALCAGFFKLGKSA